MAERSQTLAIIVTAKDLASGKLAKANAELARMGTGGKLAAVGLGTGIKAVRTAEGAARHLGGVLSGLAGPLGFIGIAGGVFALERAITGSIGKATAFGQSVAEVSRITGLSAKTTSQLVDTLEYYGISAEDQARLTGLTEKNLGALTATGKKAQAFQKTYGLALTDNKGRAKDFNTVLLTAADYFNNRSIPAQTKAAGLAKVFGRSWQQLVPILTQGSAAIRKAEADAIKLTDADLANMAKFKEATRAWDDTLGDLEVTVGARLMPTLTEGLRGLTRFVDQHSDDIVKFFEDGMAGARTLAGFITGSVIPTISGLVGAAKGFWDGIPPELRDILVKGFVADRTINFLFGLSPGKLALDLGGNILGPVLKGVLGGFGQRGGSPANPMWVASAQGGVPGIGGGLPGALGGAGGLGLLGTAGIVAAGAVAGGYAFSQTYSGPKAMGAYTPTIGSAFAPKDVSKSDFSALGAAIGRSIGDRLYKESGSRAQTPGTPEWVGRGRQGRQDNRFNEMEGKRGTSPQIVKDDRTYDAIEKVRLAATSAGDRSYDAIENLRARTTTATRGVQDAVVTQGIATRTVLGALPSAIGAAVGNAVRSIPPPQITVSATTISTTLTKQNYYGPSTGSRGGQRNSGSSYLGTTVRGGL